MRFFISSTTSIITVKGNLIRITLSPITLITLLSLGCIHKLNPDISSDDILFLKKRLTHSSQAIHKPSSWPPNRRYFFLIRTFAQMGVLRCDHFLPDPACFHPKTSENPWVLTSEKIPIQFDEKSPDRYTYFHEPDRPMRNLKNILIAQKHQKQKKDPNRSIFFDYLRNEASDVDRMIAFLESFHYFYTHCTLRPILISFVEGELGLNHSLKKSYRLSRQNSFYNEALSFFRGEGYLLLENERMAVARFLSDNPKNESLKITRDKATFFCL